MFMKSNIKIVLAQMARDGKEPQGSMGDDTPLAVLSKKPQLLYNYFKQLFAQVTNPPIDPIREESIMSLVTIVGQKANLLDNDKKDYTFIQLDTPILSDVDLEKISKIYFINFHIFYNFSEISDFIFNLVTMISHNSTSKVFDFFQTIRNNYG